MDDIIVLALTQTSFCRALCACLLPVVLTAMPSVNPLLAEETAPKADTKITKIGIAYITVETKQRIPLSRLEFKAKDEGIAGGTLAIKDNNTTGRFTKQKFDLRHIKARTSEKAVSQMEKLVAEGIGLFIVDAPAAALLELSQAAKGKDILLFNAAAEDNELREKECRKNVMHLAPSTAMLADALAQYLVWKQWDKWFLVSGTLPADKEYAVSIKRAAKRFGGKIVAERAYEYKPGASRTDGGYEVIQKQLAVFTQGAPDYDVMIVADRSQVFGTYMPFRTWSARPVAGTTNLTAESWHPASEHWAGTQMQNRFERSAKRSMRPLDYNVWLAVRAIGEAATRTKSGDFMKLRDYLQGPDFAIAGFKGQKMSFRSWNNQLRQPIVVGTPLIPVSWSPQEGFLHKKSFLDTLGYDEPESNCKF